jgi:hypothetical protein
LLRPHERDKVQLFVQGSILEVFVNDQVCLATRMYDWREGRLGLIVDNGQASFSRFDVRIHHRDTEKGG